MSEKSPLLRVFSYHIHGRRHRGDWGDGPPKFEVRRRPMHPSPNIWSSAVIGKLNFLSLCETDVYRQEKSDICYVIYQYQMRDREKTEKSGR